MADKKKDKDKDDKKKKASRRAKKTELTRLDKFFGALGLKSALQKKLEKELEEREKILERQRRLEDIDVSPQTWNFVFGDETPKTFQDVYEIKDVTPRNIWMEDNFIVNQIKAYRPDETFHSIDTYTLKWQPPKSPFRLLIPLNDLQLLENVAIQMANAGEEARSKVLFYFSPTDPLVPLFAPHVSPFALLSYRTKAAVLTKLCDHYLDAKMSLEDFTNTLLADYTVWKRAAFNMMAEDEQPYHRYLLDVPVPKVNLKKMAKKYHNDEISLAEYIDYKYPDRKKQRDVEGLDYPRPYHTADCVICHRVDCATIKCQNCPNMVCKECIATSFLEPSTKVGSFLHMHRLFCMKRGVAIDRLVSVVADAAYLVRLKQTGRLHTFATLQAEAAERERLLFQDTDDVEDDGYDSEEERRKRLLADELAKAMAVHPELVDITDGLAKVSQAYRRIKRNLIEAQLSLDKKGRASGNAFSVRLRREKTKYVNKLVSRVDSQLQFYKMRMSAMPPEVEARAPETFRGLEREITMLLEQVDLLLRMDSAREYFEGVQAIQEREEEILRKEREKKKAAELLKYSSL
jgi:hypothetical protein